MFSLTDCAIRECEQREHDRKIAGILATRQLWDSIPDARPQRIWSRAQLIIECGKASTTNRTAIGYLEEIRFYEGYSEPGYSDPDSKCVLIGNWNAVYQYDQQTGRSETADSTLPRVARLLEKIGCELEWGDEWLSCDDCGKLVRCSPDSYSWQQSYSYYWADDCSPVCHECVKADPSDYLEWLEGHASRALTMDIDLTQHGYVKLEGEYENGFHPGQDVDPKVIAKSLEEMGIERFIFSLDSTEQFDIRFSVWIAKDEFDNLTAEKMTEWETLPKNGPSVSDGLRRALQSIRHVPGDGIQVTKLDVVNGTSSTQAVMPQEFIEGKALN